MQTQKTVLTSFLVPLLAMLYGCQPEEPAKQPKAPAPAAPIVLPQSATNIAATPVVTKEVFTQLAKDIGCFACHSIEKKLLGPAWKNVAIRYSQDPSGEDKLVKKIIYGGSGAWGTIAMPAYPNLNEDKIRILVQYVLSLK